MVPAGGKGLYDAMTHWRTLLALTLTLLLGWGSVTQAMAHREMAGVSVQVLCGTSAVTVALDADGKPVADIPCTHCLAAACLAVQAAPVLPAHRLALPRPADLTRSAQPSALGTTLPPSRARAPPASV